MKAFFLAKTGFSLTTATGKPGDGDVRNLVSILRSLDEVYTSPALCGQCLQLGIKARELAMMSETCGNPYVRNIDHMVGQCLDNGVRLFITAGGDGTASYVASSVILRSRGMDIRPLFIGFPAGTANAGPIVHRLGTGNLEELTEISLDAIEVTDGDEIVGYGFNDVIIGNTFLATLDGRMVNLDAKAMALDGKEVEARPGARIAGRDFAVTLDGKAAHIPHDVMQICVSAIGAMELGPKAILGGLLNSEGDAHPAAAAFISRNMIDSDPASWNWRGPVSTTHICFTENNVLSISGLGDDAQIIVDGNPFMRKTGRLSFRIVPQACTALRDTGGKGR